MTRTQCFRFLNGLLDLQAYNEVIKPLSQALPSPAFIAEHDAMWYGITLWSAGVCCPGCVPFQVLVQAQPDRWGGRVRSRKGLEAVQALLSNN